MSKMNRYALPTALLFAVLLSACATKPTEEAAVEAAPAPAVVEPATEPAPVAEPAPAPEAVAEPAPAPAASTAEVAPEPVVKKPRRRVVKAAPPKAVEPAPVAEPAPVEAAPAPMPEPAPPAMVETPLQPVAEPGFLEKYWLWLLGIAVAAVALFFVMVKKE